MERKDANEAFYRQKVSAAQLLAGEIVPPPQADILYRALNARTAGANFNLQRGSSEYDAESRNQSPLVGRQSVSVAGRFGGGSPSTASSGYGAAPQPIAFGRASYDSRPTEHDQLPRYTPSTVGPGSAGGKPGRVSTDTNSSGYPAANHTGPKVPPRIGAKPEVVTALYDFVGEQATDLPFKKGDIITVVKKTDSRNDWWTGKLNGREGSFPANYTQ